VLRFGEIQVDKTHTGMLLNAIDEALPAADPEVAEWLNGLGVSLEAIRQEPAIYLMGRRMP
jgi:hydrogenase-4 component J